jgi:TolB-like protein
MNAKLFSTPVRVLTPALALAPALAALSLLAAVPLASAAPVPQRAAQRQPAPRVLLFPFSSIHLSNDDAWMTKSVQENLIATLDRSESFSPTAYAGKLVVEDNQAAARNARQSNFPYAIRGSIQIVDTQVRLTAQLVDSRNGNSLRTAIATGPAADLLKIEDDLSAQLLGQARGGPAATADSQASATNPAQPPIQIFIQNTPSSPSLAEPASYPYSYAGYPNYGYGTPYYPGYYPGVVIISDNHGGHHDHDHDHDHDGHGGDNGGGIHFETSGPQNGTNTPGTPMSPGGINSNPDYHPTYTRPPLPGPAPGSDTPRALTPAPARVGTSDPRSGR